MLHGFGIMPMAAYAEFGHDTGHLVSQQGNFAGGFAVDACCPETQETMLADHGAAAVEFFCADIVEIGGAMDGSQAVRFRHKQRFSRPRKGALRAGQHHACAVVGAV